MKDLNKELERKGVPKYVIWALRKLMAEKLGMGEDADVRNARVVTCKKPHVCAECKEPIDTKSQAWVFASFRKGRYLHHECFNKLIVGFTNHMLSLLDLIHSAYENDLDWRDSVLYDEDFVGC